jgi:hypothetical protein
MTKYCNKLLLALHTPSFNLTREWQQPYTYEPANETADEPPSKQLFVRNRSLARFAASFYYTISSAAAVAVLSVSTSASGGLAVSAGADTTR